jgi:two-component system, OmpR family, response regulator NblR
MTTSAASPCVLIVESDEGLAQTIATDLHMSGYDVAIAPDYSTGFKKANQLQPDLIVIDRMLGTDSGFKLCQQLRRLGARAPVLMLMTRDAVDDRVACLESGADDYFIKPYRMDDFIHRVQLYLQPEANNREELRFEDLVLDLATRRAVRRARSIELTTKEFELLRYLMEHPREVLTREQILENVWGYEFMGESNVIEVYVRYLRLKIEHEGEKRLIQTVRGVGYVLRDG